jgi:hypothetical protein
MTIDKSPTFVCHDTGQILVERHDEFILRLDNDLPGRFDKALSAA